ncbi:MAG: M20/M25/M40 family metallo-hydrolase [Proteobacteria bacterium]|nr:M20/M25/M40 family metallo-hydrolase [Pseudomonadota bacterium]
MQKNFSENSSGSWSRWPEHGPSKKPQRGKIVTHIKWPLLAVCIALSACGQDPEIQIAADTAGPVQRPRFEISGDEVFDAGSIPAYAGSHDEIYAHIDRNLERHLANLQRWVRQPSISAQNNGITEMAGMLLDDLLAIGFAEAELVPTEGHPGIFAYYDAGAEKTLVVYMMYDVQPVNPEDWLVPPFAGELVEHDLGTVLMARGATNQKGPERALLNALESIISVTGSLPVNLIVLAEGEEELGSPHFPQVVEKFKDRLMAADGVLFPFNSQNRAGDTRMILGVKGIIYLELEARGGAHGGPVNHEVHGSLKANIDSPVWRLVQALASMTTPDGNTILIDGYYDKVQPPPAEDMPLINGMLAATDEKKAMRALGIERWIDGETMREAQMDYLYNPTLNINGIWAGYTGEGTKTILPHMATAKVDSRLPPGLDPDEMMALIRTHLDKHGFTDITIRPMSGYPASQTSLDSELVQMAISVFNKYGAPPSVEPRLGGSAPFYVFTDILQLPMVFTGIGHGNGAHGPNEIMVIYPKEGSKIAGLARMEKGYVDILHALAGQ